MSFSQTSEVKDMTDNQMQKNIVVLALTLNITHINLILKDKFTFFQVRLKTIVVCPYVHRYIYFF